MTNHSAPSVNVQLPPLSHATAEHLLSLLRRERRHFRDDMVIAWLEDAVLFAIARATVTER